MVGFPNRFGSDSTCWLEGGPQGWRIRKIFGIGSLTRLCGTGWAAAARFEVSESSAIKWVQRWERKSSRTPAKLGGYLRPKLEPHRAFL
jgi:hypothetical protein